jgi:serine/threonine protein kinase
LSISSHMRNKLSVRFARHAMNDNEPRKFGKYELLERIAVGGMAELFKAKVTAEGGFEKLLVIKRILPHLSEDENLVSMFIDEARLAALLSHRNIVQIYDFGKENGTYYIAMEYLEGKDLKAILRRAEPALPLQFALYITSRICAGLEHSHNLKDLKDAPLNLIHRDISPQNVFITYPGEVKILDFGIAKAASQSSFTRVGVLKGKVSYMSPEQASGKKIDKRSDIFSTGVLLYEMVSGLKTFEGDTMEVLDRVRRADFEPLESIASGLPEEVYSIVRKALSKSIETRYQTCGEMLKAIEACLAQFSDRPGAGSLSSYVHDLFSREDALDGSTIARGDQVAAGLQANGDLDEPVEKTTTAFDEETAYNPTLQGRARGWPRGRWLAVGGLGAAVMAAVLLAVLLRPGPIGMEKPDRVGPASPSAAMETNEAGETARLPVNTVPQPSETAKTTNSATPPTSNLPVDRPLEMGTAPSTTADGEDAGPAFRDAKSYLDLAKLQTKAHNYSKAIESYKRAGEIDPTFPDTFFNMGYLYAKMKDYAASEDMFKRAAALSPSYLDEVMYNLAMVQKAQGKIGECVESLERALGFNPENARASEQLKRLRAEEQGRRQ